MAAPVSANPSRYNRSRSRAKRFLGPMKSPIFIVGCPRSGTSYLYHLLLSAGGFAEFHTQMNVYDVLEPIYGDLGVNSNKDRMLKEWLRSKAFRVSGLSAQSIDRKIRSEAHTTS